jgi:hypothetical protein
MQYTAMCWYWYWFTFFNSILHTFESRDDEHRISASHLSGRAGTVIECSTEPRSSTKSIVMTPWRTRCSTNPCALLQAKKATKQPENQTRL